MAHPSHRRSPSGYSLVELSVVLAVLGLLGGAILSVNASKIESQNILATSAEFDTIDATIVNYVNLNGALPCPARANAAENSTYFGRANCVQAEGALPTAGSGVTAVDFGVVPTRSLGLPDRMMYDSWGNRITYAVIKNMTDNTLYSGYRSANTATTGVITIIDSIGTRVTPASAYYIVPYVLVSAGPDKIGAYSRSSNTSTMTTPSVACGSSTLDSTNCGHTTTFRDMAINNSATASAYFFDLLRWHTFDSSLLNTN